jgi:hypothetical protein
MSYDVGYGKPPKQGRFRKGESGNLAGRPRGRVTIRTLLRKALREKVIITENGNRKVITKLEAAIKQLVNLCAAGNLEALRLLNRIMREQSDDSSADNSMGKYMQMSPEEIQVRLGELQAIEEALTRSENKKRRQQSGSRTRGLAVEHSTEGQEPRLETL